MGPWLKHAVKIGLGFLEGYAESRNDRNNQPTFADVMLHLGRETELRVEIVDECAAEFFVQAAGQTYSVVVVERGGELIINAVSTITFPEGQAPVEVCRVLKKQNQELARCDFDLYSGRTGDQFMVKTCVRCETLTVAIFEAAVEEIVARAAILDRVLVKTGYTR
jgi:hypothetical protein